MAEAGQKPEKANTAVPHQGDHDRVAMLSLNADGTANQHNPEIILSKDAAVEAATRQFSEQAVSAVDVEKRGVSAEAGVLVGQEDGSTKEVSASDVPQDPSIVELQKAHEGAAKAATSAAESAVGDLAKG